LEFVRFRLPPFHSHAFCRLHSTSDTFYRHPSAGDSFRIICHPVFSNVSPLDVHLISANVIPHHTDQRQHAFGHPAKNLKFQMLLFRSHAFCQRLIFVRFRLPLIRSPRFLPPALHFPRFSLPPIRRRHISKSVPPCFLKYIPSGCILNISECSPASYGPAAVYIWTPCQESGFPIAPIQFP
jgi:hypothetical protein